MRSRVRAEEVTLARHRFGVWELDGDAGAPVSAAAGGYVTKELRPRRCRLRGPSRPLSQESLRKVDPLVQFLEFSFAVLQCAGDRIPDFLTQLLSNQIGNSLGIWAANAAGPHPHADGRMPLLGIMVTAACRW